MTLLIGKKKFGFIFLEVLLAVTILSVGIIAVYQPLLASVSAFNYADERVEAKYFISDKIYQLKQDIQVGITRSLNSTETLLGKGRIYEFTASSLVSDLTKGFYQVTLLVAWSSAGKKRQIERQVYLLKPPPKKKSE